MTIVIIDGQGGRIGTALIETARRVCPQAQILAVGINSAASLAMRKASPDGAATGENAVKVCCRKADVIMGPIGIVIADSMLGEVTPAMAAAVGQADAVRILIPSGKCDNLVAGVPAAPLNRILEDAGEKLAAAMEEKCLN